MGGPSDPANAAISRAVRMMDRTFREFSMPVLKWVVETYIYVPSESFAQTLHRFMKSSGVRGPPWISTGIPPQKTPPC